MHKGKFLLFVILKILTVNYFERPSANTRMNEIQDKYTSNQITINCPKTLILQTEIITGPKLQAKTTVGAI